MADSESAALTGLGDTPALGAVGETRTLMTLATATSRLRVYQFRHDRLALKKTFLFSLSHSQSDITGTNCEAANINAEPGWIASHPSQQALQSQLQREPASSVRSSPYRARHPVAAGSAC